MTVSKIGSFCLKVTVSINYNMNMCRSIFELSIVCSVIYFEGTIGAAAKRFGFALHAAASILARPKYLCALQIVCPGLCVRTYVKRF